MKKSMGRSLSICGLVLTTSVYALSGTYGAVPKIIVHFRGTPLKFASSVRPYRSQGTVMLPFRETAKLVGAKASLEPDGKYLIISYSADTLAYEIGHHGYKVNGHRQFMRATSEMHKNHLFVPIRLFNDVTAGRVHAELH